MSHSENGLLPSSRAQGIWCHKFNSNLGVFKQPERDMGAKKMRSTEISLRSSNGTVRTPLTLFFIKRGLRQMK